MTVKMTIYITNPEMTKRLKALDIFQPDKYLVTPLEAEIETTTPINDAYFQGLVDNSLRSDDPLERHNEVFIAAIQYGSNAYFNRHVKIMSDGNNEMFINENWRQK